MYTPDFIKSLCSSYRTLKQQYQQVIFFFKEQGFCTLLHADAREAAQLLGLPLEKINRTDVLQFPAENMDTHLSFLVKKGNRIAIVEPQ